MHTDLQALQAHLQPSRLEQEVSTAVQFPDLFIELGAGDPHTTVPVLIRVQLNIAAQGTFSTERKHRSLDHSMIRFCKTIQSCRYYIYFT